MSAIKEIYLGTTKVRPSGWKPGANTIAYYPLSSATTVNDMSGNNRNLSDYGATTTYVNKDGVSCAYFNGTTNLLYSSIITTTFIGQTFTISYWIADANQCGVTCIRNNPYNGWALFTETGALGRIRGEFLNNGTPRRLMPNISHTAGWHNVLMTHNSDGASAVYYDGVSKSTGSCQLGLSDGVFTIGGSASTGDVYYIEGYIGNVIIEDKVRTDQEVADYYNSTKSNYGL